MMDALQRTWGAYVRLTLRCEQAHRAQYILNVMAKHPELFSDLSAIPADVAIKPGFVFNP